MKSTSAELGVWVERVLSEPRYGTSHVPIQVTKALVGRTHCVVGGHLWVSGATSVWPPSAPG